MRPDRHPPRRPRPRLVPVPDEMKQWAALLGAELKAWPGVTSRPMFGFDAYYRGGRIFAVLPRTRALENPYAIGYKLRPARTAKEKVGVGGPGWQSLELDSGRDLGRALGRLEQAWRQAGGGKRV